MLTGYFFARLMARNLKEGAPRARDLWKKPLYEPAREFLPEAITEILGDRSGAMLAKFANSSKDGLMLWNIAQALGSALPKDLCKGKDLTGIVLESDKPGGRLDLRQMVFDNSNLHDVIFLRCDLRGANSTTSRLATLDFSTAPLAQRLIPIHCSPGTRPK